jgi:hypothetical protein
MTSPAKDMDEPYVPQYLLTDLIQSCLPCPSPTRVQILFNLFSTRELLTNEYNPSIRLITVDTSTRAAIVTYLGPGKGLFIPLPASSSRDLNSSKAHGGGVMSNPGQNQYPVSYFFYSTLAQPKNLGEVIGL